MLLTLLPQQVLLLQGKGWFYGFATLRRILCRAQATLQVHVPHTKAHCGAWQAASLTRAVQGLRVNMVKQQEVRHPPSSIPFDPDSDIFPNMVPFPNKALRSDELLTHTELECQQARDREHDALEHPRCRHPCRSALPGV